MFKLLAVDPYLVHAYWEVTDQDLVAARRRLGGARKKVRPVLRFYDITHILFDGKNAHGFFDVEIDLMARNWYVHLWSPEKSYCADLGLKTPQGRFLAILRSNITHTPPAWPSPRVEERYMRVRKPAEAKAVRSTGPYIARRGEWTVGSLWQIGGKPAKGRGDRTEKRGKGESASGRALGEAAIPGRPGMADGIGPSILPVAGEMRGVDLTGLSEQLFYGGISSWRLPSGGE